MASPASAHTPDDRQLPFFHNTGPNKRSVIRQVIKLEPNDSPTLFAMRPILELSAPTRLPPYLNPIDGTHFPA